MPLIVDEPTWIPELDREDLLYHRLFLAEKWLVLKLRYGHANPRDAGIGNIVNCGAAMYIAPVGIANACDPDGAYLEALDLTAGHQSSYGREAAGVLAAAVAEAMRPGATPESVVAVGDPARQGRDADRDRGGRRGRGRARRLARRGPGDSPGRDRAVRLGRRALRRRRRRTPAPRAASGRSRRFRSRSAYCSRPTATTSRRCSAASTTAATPTRSPRWEARSPGRSGSTVPPELVEEIGDREPARPRGAGPRHGRRGRRDPGTRPGALRGPRPGAGGARGSRRLRVTWIQPEDLVGHELRQAREEGKDVDGVERRWFDAGGKPAPTPRGVAGAGRAGAARGGARAARRARRASTPAGGLRARRAGGDPRARRSRAAVARPTPSGSPAPGSAARSAACSGSRSRTSRARGSTRSRRERATGR